LNRIAAGHCVPHPHLVVAGDTTAPCVHASGVKNTYLSIPILAQREALGILHFQATDDAPVMADAELSFKTTFAGQVRLSVANIRLREALRAQSIRDPLTGLYNRRYLTEMLDREIRCAVRAEQSLGILMLDGTRLQCRGLRKKGVAFTRGERTSRRVASDRGT
jgi:GAF domain-containing protein